MHCPSLTKPLSLPSAADRREERAKSSGGERGTDAQLRADPGRRRPFQQTTSTRGGRGGGGRGEGRRERDSLSKRELKCSPANPSQQSRMSDIRVELIRDLGPSRQRGDGALDPKPNPRGAERERWWGPSPGPGRLQPAMGSARRAAVGNKAPRSTALHRNALPSSGCSGGRGQEGGDGRGQALAQSRLGSHTAVRGAPTCAVPPPQAGTRPTGTRVPRHAAPSLLLRAAGKGCPAGAQAAPRVTPCHPSGPHEHPRVGEGTGVLGGRRWAHGAAAWTGTATRIFVHTSSSQGPRPTRSRTGDTSLHPDHRQPHLPALHLGTSPSLFGWVLLWFCHYHRSSIQLPARQTEILLCFPEQGKVITKSIHAPAAGTQPLQKTHNRHCPRKLVQDTI